MLRLAADENFNGNIVCGLLRRRPDLDTVRVQDVGQAIEDILLLTECSLEDEWEGRVAYIPLP